MKDHQHLFSVERMSKVLGVSKQGFYKYLKRTPSKREHENTRILLSLQQNHKASFSSYGHRRHVKELLDQGERVGKGRVIRLMKANGIVAKAKKAFRVTTESKHSFVLAPNELNREFSSHGPDQKWVSDISYIPTKDGFLYLAVIIDLFSRMVVGMHMAESLDRYLVIDALKQAQLRRNYPRGLMFHSDRGIQYACDDFRMLLKSMDIKQSMSRKGNCWDNAVAESFFGTLKSELMADNKFTTKQEARRSIFRYVEVFYNRKRRHSALGYLPPNEFEAWHSNGRITVN
jgi:putative transposase